MENILTRQEKKELRHAVNTIHDISWHLKDSKIAIPDEFFSLMDWFRASKLSDECI
ncbi:MAG: hypothetical protein NUV98_07315 [Candidatus Roizmanbacteria bacterium]|nr:hypothetical protein [Candidatus Roizmanbacteria bacterium]